MTGHNLWLMGERCTLWSPQALGNPKQNPVVSPSREHTAVSAGPQSTSYDPQDKH